MTEFSVSSLLWNLGDGSSSTQSSLTHEYATAGQYDVSLIATSPLGCKDTLNQTVTAHPKPIADFSVTSVCQTAGSAFTDGSSVTVSQMM